MREILNIARKTNGRPDVLEAPDAGWTYQVLSELPAGIYHVELGKKIETAPDGAGAGEFPEDEIAAGHTFAILARSTNAWDKQVASLMKTVERQADLIVKLYGQLEKATEGQGTDSLASLASLAPVLRGLLASPREGKAEEKDK